MCVETGVRYDSYTQAYNDMIRNNRVGAYHNIIKCTQFKILTSFGYHWVTEKTVGWMWIGLKWNAEKEVVKVVSKVENFMRLSL